MTDAQLKCDAMSLLREKLGLVESERFLTLIQREQFDYTEWRRMRRTDSTVAELSSKARQMRAKPE